MKNSSAVTGVITSRRCPTCGHHEVGYQTSDGVFFPLKPGDKVSVIRDSYELNPVNPTEAEHNVSEGIENNISELDRFIFGLSKLI